MGTEGEAKKRMATKTKAAMTVYNNVLCGGGAGRGYALELEKDGLRLYRDGAGIMTSWQISISPNAMGTYYIFLAYST